MALNLEFDKVRQPGVSRGTQKDKLHYLRSEALLNLKIWSN